MYASFALLVLAGTLAAPVPVALAPGAPHQKQVVPVRALGPPSAARSPGAKAAPDAEAVEQVETVEVQNAADGPETWWGDAWPRMDRVVDAYTARTTRRRTFSTLINHRNYGGWLRDPFHSFLGFDRGSLKVVLGVRYGILDKLDVGVLRVNATLERFATYEFDARYQILDQKNFGIDLALRAGVDWFSQPSGHADASGFIGQLLADRLIADRVLLGGGLLYASNSSGPVKSTTDSHSSLALQVYADTRISSGFSVFLEVTEPLAGYAALNPAISFGPRFITNRHTFSIVLSNTQYTSADGIVTGSPRTSFRDFVLGFNITREL